MSKPSKLHCGEVLERPETEIEMTRLWIPFAVRYWNSFCRSNFAVPTPALTVQAVVEDGKIRSLVYRPGTLVRGPGHSATEMTPESAATALAALLLFGLGLLSLASARSHHRSGSHLRGRLVRHLRGWRPRVSPAT